MDQNCLSYWFPKLVDAGIPVPNTIIVPMHTQAAQDVYRTFDCLPVGPAATSWIENILRPAVENIGTPCFLRTGQTSGKHRWKHTCYVTDSANLIDNVLAIIEFSEVCNMFGLPWGVWAVRELLPTTPMAIADKYGDMPVCREFRFFVRDGAVQCAHPYWPRQSLEQGISSLPRDFDRRVEYLSFVPEPERLHELAERAGKAVGGYWSVDILDTTRGWFVTDMAIGEQSWHWPECKNSQLR